MVHDIHKCGVRGTRSRLQRIRRACGITQIHDISGVYTYGVLAGGVLGVGLLVCGVVSAVSMGGWEGWCTGLPVRPCGRNIFPLLTTTSKYNSKTHIIVTFSHPLTIYQLSNPITYFHIINLIPLYIFISLLELV